eukprot:SAG11_NODE_5487_length_1547_cov_3.100138_1_plen_158_part_01
MDHLTDPATHDFVEHPVFGWSKCDVCGRSKAFHIRREHSGVEGSESASFATPRPVRPVYATQLAEADAAVDCPATPEPTPALAAAAAAAAAGGARAAAAASSSSSSSGGGRRGGRRGRSRRSKRRRRRRHPDRRSKGRSRGRSSSSSKQLQHEEQEEQ